MFSKIKNFFGFNQDTSDNANTSILDLIHNLENNQDSLDKNKDVVFFFTKPKHLVAPMKNL